MNFIGMRTFDDFLSLAVYVRDRVNPTLFHYALSVAILHRKDTKDLEVPSLSENFPDKFMAKQVFAKAREVANVVTTGNRVLIKFFIINKLQLVVLLN